MWSPKRCPLISMNNYVEIATQGWEGDAPWIQLWIRQRIYLFIIFLFYFYLLIDILLLLTIFGGENASVRFWVSVHPWIWGWVESGVYCQMRCHMKLLLLYGPMLTKKKKVSFNKYYVERGTQGWEGGCSMHPPLDPQIYLFIYLLLLLIFI